LGTRSVNMPILKTSEADFEAKFAALKERLRCMLAPGERGAEGGKAIAERVEEVLEAVRTRGDGALLELTERFDGCRLSAGQLRVKRAEIDAAVCAVPGELLEALRFAAERIREFQRATLPQEPPPLRSGGRTSAVRYRPVDSAGLYVPGGTASLASSVLMSAVPAKVAGVRRIVMATPPRRDGSISADRLAAADVAGVTEIYRVGGAQAIAALAFGTETVPAVDFIAGPGNIYVALAKRSVFGRVGIDMVGGPSEVVVVADSTANPRWLAADMIAQAEHNPGSAVLITDSEALANETAEALERELGAIARSDLALNCLERYGAMICTGALDECVELANGLAPEHLQIVTADPEAVSEGIRHAGAIFLGPFSPVAVGDYVAGPSHVLPTGTTARFSSGLSAADFLKRTSIIRYDRRALQRDAEHLYRIAGAEALDGHSRSVSVRLERERDAEELGRSSPD